MKIQKHDIIRGLKEVGIKAGDIVLVHSSLKSFGYVDGGALSVIEALLDACTPEGTVMAPTITGKREHGRNNPPYFDVLRTPCWTGIIPETLRKMPDAQRSLHPTHSVAALGNDVQHLLGEHVNSYTPCDEKSPYQKNAESGGKILLLGVSQETNTTLHACEEIAKVPYHLQKEESECTIKDAKGEEHRVINRLHSWEGPERNFSIVNELLESRGLLKRAMVGNCLITIMPAQELIGLIVHELKRNPFYLCKGMKG